MGTNVDRVAPLSLNTSRALGLYQSRNVASKLVHEHPDSRIDVREPTRFLLERHGAVAGGSLVGASQCPRADAAFDKAVASRLNSEIPS